MKHHTTTRERRTFRSRRKIRRQVDTGRLRLSVFRSDKHIYAQIIDDNAGNTVASASSIALKLSGDKKEQAAAVGKALAEAALRSEEHTSELQSRGHLVCRLLLEKKKDRTSRECRM